MKFIVDMNLSPVVALWLTSQGHDAIHVIDVKLHTASDKEIFDFAGQAKRIIVTADLDFPRILAMSGSINPALILFRGGNFSDKEIISLLSKALTALPEQKIVHSLVVIEKNRIRRRDLPI